MTSKIVTFIFIILSVTQLYASDAPFCRNRNFAQLPIGNGEVLDFVITRTGPALSHHLDGSTTLSFEATTNKAVLRSRNGSNSIISRPFTQRELKIIKAVNTVSNNDYKKQIEICQAIPDKVVPLKHPLTSLEIKECSSTALKVKDLHECFSKSNCDDVYKKYYSFGKLKTEKEYSFRQLLETGSGILTPKNVAIGTATTASWLWELRVVQYILKNRSSLALKFTKTGVVVGGAGAIAISWLLVPATGYLFGTDNCAQNTKPDDFDYEDCLGKTDVQLSEILRTNLNEATKNPKQFENHLKNKDRALESRLTCTLLENLSDNFDSLMNTMTCQGKTVQIGSKEEYLIGKSGHLYRHKDGYYTHHFDLQNNRVWNEKRASGIPDLQITPVVREELEMLRVLRPRLKEVIANCGYKLEVEDSSTNVQ